MSSGAIAAYLDSNVFIYLIEGEPPVSRVVQRLFKTFEQFEGIFVTSELTLAEVLAPTGTGTRGAYRRDYLDAILANRSVRTVPVTRDILIETTEVRINARRKLPDAIHCATAALSGCRFLISNDRQMQRLPTGIVWLDFVDQTVNVLLDATHG